MDSMGLLKSGKSLREEKRPFNKEISKQSAELNKSAVIKRPLQPEGSKLKKEEKEDKVYDSFVIIEKERQISEGAAVGFAEKKKEKAGSTRLEMERSAWKTFREYKKKGAEVSGGAVDISWDRLDFKGLMEVLEKNAPKKSVYFANMKAALNKLLSFSENGGFSKESLDINGNVIDESKIQSFQAAYYEAKITVQNFISTRSTLGRWFVPFSGKDARYQAAVRIDRMLSDIMTEVKLSQNLIKRQMEEEEKEGSEEEKRESRLENILKTGELKDGDLKKDEEKSDIDNAWIEEGYQEKLLELVKGNENIKTDTDFMRFALDQKNQIAARELSIVLFSEESRDVTLGIPALKEKLRTAIADELKGKKELLEGDFDAFRSRLDNMKKAYAAEHAKEIESVKNRISSMEMVLGRKSLSAEMLSREDVGRLLTESDEESFKDELIFLSANALKNEKLVNEMVKERVSALSRKKIFNVVKERLGELLIFGSLNELSDAAGAALDAAIFSCTEEAMLEKRINAVCSHMGIAKTYRDGFSLFWAKRSRNSSYMDDLKIGGEFLLRQRENEAYSSKAVKGVKMSFSQWRRYEKLLNTGGFFSAKDFKERLKNLMSEEPKDKNAKAISKSDYTFGVNAYKKLKGELSAEGRLRGDLFIGSKELKEGLSAEERKELQKNLKEIVLSNISEERGIKDLSALNNYTPRELRAFSKLLIRNIMEKRELLKASLKDIDDNELKSRLNSRMLLAMAKGEAATDELFSKTLGTEKKIALWDIAMKNANVPDEAEIKKSGEERSEELKLELEFTKKRENKDKGLWAGLWKWAYGVMGWETGTSYEDNLGAAAKKLKDSLKKEYGDKEADSRLSLAFTHWQQLLSSGKKEDMEVFAKSEDLLQSGLNALKNHKKNEKTAAEELKKYIEKDSLIKEKLKGSDEKETGEYRRYFENQFAAYLSDKALFMDADSFKARLKKSIPEFTAYFFAEKAKNVDDKRSAKAKAEAMNRAKEMAEKIAEAKAAGQKERDPYLGLDNKSIDKLLATKSLVRAKRVSGKEYELNIRKGRRDYEWQRIEAYGGFELPEIVKACVVERSLSYHLSDEEFRAHVTQLSHIYKNINSHLPEGMEEMSEDERNLFTVHLYSQEYAYRLFNSVEPCNKDELVEKPVFKAFRKSYGKLKEFENTETGDDMLSGEKAAMSKNLRTCLANGTGLLDKDGKNFDVVQRSVEKGRDANEERAALFIDAAERHLAYITYKNEALSLINEKMREILKEEKLIDGKMEKVPYTEYAYERYLQGMRAYYQEKILDDLKNGKKFQKNEWEQLLFNDLTNDAFIRNIRGRDGHNTGETREFEMDRAFDDGYSMDDIEYTINRLTYLPGAVKRFKKLDDDQRRLFVFALMVMNKSAAGMELAGSNMVLELPGQKEKREEEGRQAVSDYIEGKEFHLKLDYKDAIYKLINKGEYMFVHDPSLSDTAFNKAMEFAESVKLRKTYNSDRDLERMGDGETLIMEAARLFGKPQLEVLDRLKEKNNDPDSVRDELYDMALREGEERIAGRLKNMDERELKLFVKIMQNRTLLDESTIKHDETEFLSVDAEGRAELYEALIGDATRKEELKDTGSNESCIKALATAYSFQLKDDITRTGTHITKEHFKEKSISRKTLVDWELVKKAYNLLVDIKKQILIKETVQNAPAYIEKSGNARAIEEYDKLKKAKGETKAVNENDFEDYLLKEAKNDGMMRELGGYLSFNDVQKKLFIKVLGRRDLLDISKKNYLSSFFFGKDRDFVNVADRFALIDEHIRQAAQGNSGVALTKDSRYNALCTLFSTQMTDVDEIDFNKGIGARLTSERLLFMGRKTAIDWKLFKRAVSFVNRATTELNYAEGNEELYRSAGDIERNGGLKMDYSQLRKNYHRSGGHIMRKITDTSGARGYAQHDKETLDSFIPPQVETVVRKSKSSHLKSVRAIKQKKLGQVRVKAGRSTKYESSLEMDVIRNNINKIISNSATLQAALDKIAGYARSYGYYPAKAEPLKLHSFLKEGEAPKGIKYEAKYGDFRDKAVPAGKAVSKVKENIDYVMTSVAPAYAMAFPMIVKKFGSDMSKDPKLSELLKKGDNAGAVIRAEELLQAPFNGFLKSRFGDSTVKAVTDEIKRIAKGTEDFTKEVVAPALQKYKLAMTFTENIQSIYTNLKGLDSMRDAKTFSSEKEDEDSKTLKEAGKFQTEKQKEMSLLTADTQKKLMEAGWTLLP